jgi:hypothetical protein
MVAAGYVARASIRIALRFVNQEFQWQNRMIFGVQA